MHFILHRQIDARWSSRRFGDVDSRYRAFRCFIESCRRIGELDFTLWAFEVEKSRHKLGSNDQKTLDHLQIRQYMDGEILTMSLSQTLSLLPNLPNPACYPTLRPSILEGLDRIPCPKPDRSEDAVPESLRRAHQWKGPRPPNRLKPDPHRTDEPLLGPRNDGDRSLCLTPNGKGAAMLLVRVAQQRLWYGGDRPGTLQLQGLSLRTRDDQEQ